MPIVVPIIHPNKCFSKLSQMLRFSLRLINMKRNSVTLAKRKVRRLRINDAAITHLRKVIADDLQKNISSMNP